MAESGNGERDKAGRCLHGVAWEASWEKVTLGWSEAWREPGRRGREQASRSPVDGWGLWTPPPSPSPASGTQA